MGIECFFAYAAALLGSRAAIAATMTSGWDLEGRMMARGLISVT